MVTTGHAVGIERVGVAIPRRRLSASDVNAFWSGRGKGATTAIANWDEDPITLAVTAAERCLEGRDRSDVTALVFASTSFPYEEKQNAAVVAEALGLAGLALIVDLGSSLAAGVDAVRIGLDHVAANGGTALVVAADKRVAEPGTPDETRWGDAGVAVLVGSGVTATVEFVHTEVETALSTWRFPGRLPRHADARFVSERVAESLVSALTSVKDAAAGRGRQLSGAVVVSDVGREAERSLRMAGLDGLLHTHGPALQQSIGFTGVAAPLVALAQAFRAAGPSESIALAVHADGARGAVVTCVDRVPVVGSPDDEAPVPLAYPEFLRIRGHLGEQVVSPFSSEIEQWRDREVISGPVGSRDTATGRTVFPPRSVRLERDGARAVELVPLARRGTLYTFTVEHLFPNPEGRLSMGVVELDDGVRFYCQMADVDPETLEIGMRVELAYRRIHEGGGFINYFWKAVPEIVPKEVLR